MYQYKNSDILNEWDRKLWENHMKKKEYTEEGRAVKELVSTHLLINIKYHSIEIQKYESTRF